MAQPKRSQIDEQRESVTGIIAVITKEIEGRFERVLVPEPAAQVNFLPLKKAPDPYIGPSVAIPFVRITSDTLDLKTGMVTLWPTASAAIVAWKGNMDQYLEQWPDVKTLFWRVRPEIDYDRNFETGKHGWKVYSRLAVH